MSKMSKMNKMMLLVALLAGIASAAAQDVNETARPFVEIHPSKYPLESYVGRQFKGPGVEKLATYDKIPEGRWPIEAGPDGVCLFGPLKVTDPDGGTILELGPGAQFPGRCAEKRSP